MLGYGCSHCRGDKECRCASKNRANTSGSIRDVEDVSAIYCDSGVGGDPCVEEDREQDCVGSDMDLVRRVSHWTSILY